MHIPTHSQFLRRRGPAVRRRARQRGAIGLMGGLVLMLALLFTVLAVDAGRLWMERRNLQKIADMAALQSARYTGCGGSLTSVQSAAEDVARENGLSDSLEDDTATITSEHGKVTVDAAGISTFTAIASDKDDGTNGTRVVVTRKVPKSLVMGGLSINPEDRLITLTASATARGGPPITTLTLDAAMFQVASIAEQFDALWLQVAGGSPPLSANQLQRLAASSISLRNLMQAGGFDTVDELMDSDMTIGELLRTYSEAAARNNTRDPDVEAALGSLAGAAGTLGTNIKLKDILELNDGSKDALIDSEINLFGLVTTSLRVLGKESGAFAFEPSVKFAGVAGVDFKLLDVPRLAWGPGGKSSSGAWCTQTQSTDASLRIYLAPTVIPNGGLLGSILRPLSILLSGILELDLGIQFDFGNAAAYVTAIEANAGTAKVHLNADTSLVRVKYTNSTGTDDGGIFVKLFGARILGIKIGNYDAIPQFAPMEVSVDTPIYAFGNLPAKGTGSSETAGTLSALLKSAPPKITPVFLEASIDSGKLVDALTTLLVNTIAPILNAGLDQQLRSLGISFGAAKIAVYDIQNQEPQLVN